MARLYQLCCPKCNNKTDFYRYGKDKSGHQKYQCRKCQHQWVPDAPKGQPGRPRTKEYPQCPVCGKAMYVHHNQEHYIHYGKNSFRNIALILRTVMNVQVSHTTISNWCTKFAPMFQKIAIQLVPALNFNSDEWHADETVVKIQGQKYYLWLVLDSETRFLLGFHLSPHRDSPQAYTILEAVKPMGSPQAIVSDRYFAYQMPVKTLHGVQHIRVQSFRDDITNNLAVSSVVVVQIPMHGMSSM